MSRSGALWRWSRAFAPAVAWAVLLLAVGSAQVSGPQTDLPLDKLAHFVLYAILGALLGWGAARVDARGPIGALLLCAALLVGAADETNQRRVEGRSSEVADWVADAAGVLAGFALARRLTPAARGARNDSSNREDRAG